MHLQCIGTQRRLAPPQGVEGGLQRPAAAAQTPSPQRRLASSPPTHPPWQAALPSSRPASEVDSAEGAEEEAPLAAAGAGAPASASAAAAAAAVPVSHSSAWTGAGRWGGMLEGKRAHGWGGPSPAAARRTRASAGLSTSTATTATARRVRAQVRAGCRILRLVPAPGARCWHQVPRAAAPAARRQQLLRHSSDRMPHARASRLRSLAAAPPPAPPAPTPVPTRPPHLQHAVAVQRELCDLHLPVVEAHLRAGGRGAAWRCLASS
jgi:hypothetical protein